MAKSKCLGCGSTNFEAQVNVPTGSNFKIVYIQCASCGGVVGVMPATHTNSLIRDLAKKMGFNLD